MNIVGNLAGVWSWQNKFVVADVFGGNTLDKHGINWEKDALISNGVCRFLQEKFTKHSDGFDTYICRRCGFHAAVNHELKLYRCKICEDDAEIALVKSTWSAKQLNHELGSMNIGMRYKLKPYTFPV